MSKDPAKHFMPEPPTSGWWFSVHPLGEVHNRETVLATWSAKGDGKRWLQDMTGQGKAMATADSQDFRGHYLVKLADLLPVLDAPPSRRDQFEYQHHPDRIAACEPEAVMHVTVFDQS